MVRRVCYITKAGMETACVAMGEGGRTDIIDCHQCETYKKYRDIILQGSCYTAWGGEIEQNCCLKCESFLQSPQFDGCGYCGKHEGAFISEMHSCEYYVERSD
jgi:hypothetical protein